MSEHEGQNAADLFDSPDEAKNAAGLFDAAGEDRGPADEKPQVQPTRNVNTTTTIDSSERSELFAALAKAQGEISPMRCSGHNDFAHYYYPTLEDHIDVLRPVLPRHGLAVWYTVSETTGPQERKTAQGKTEYFVSVSIAMTLSHEGGETLAIEAFGSAQAGGDKALAQAVTAARKAGLAALFNLAPGDDPEAGGDKPDSGRRDKGRGSGRKQQPPREEKPPAPSQRHADLDEKNYKPDDWKSYSFLLRGFRQAVAPSDVDRYGAEHKESIDKLAGELRDVLRNEARTIKKKLEGKS